MKRIQITLSDDLVQHLEALKLYYDYKSRSAVVEKALDELIRKCVSDDVFHYYLTCARKELRDRQEKRNNDDCILFKRRS